MKLPKSLLGLCVVFVGTLSAIAQTTYYVTNIADRTISSVTSAGVVSTFASGFASYPEGLAIDASGNIYTSELINGDGVIYKYAQSGSRSILATISGHELLGMAIDSAGNLYAADAYTGSELANKNIWKISPAGAVSLFASGVSDPYTLAFKGSDLYLSNYLPGKITKVDSTGATSNFVSGFSRPLGIAFDSSGNLFVANAEAGPGFTYGAPAIYKIGTSGDVSLFASLTFTIQGLTFDSSGALFGADPNNKIHEFDLDGTSTVFATGLNSPNMIQSYTVSAIPEPSTYAVLVGAAILVFAFYRRRNGS